MMSAAVSAYSILNVSGLPTSWLKSTTSPGSEMSRRVANCSIAK